MPVRIAVKMPPLWEVALAYLLTAATVVALVWLCARIYRVGILMHGKKPTLAEIVRWVRYA
jgi:ABC-2 type transport system permease protein